MMPSRSTWSIRWIVVRGLLGMAQPLPACVAAGPVLFLFSLLMARRLRV